MKKVIKFIKEKLTNNPISNYYSKTVYLKDRKRYKNTKPISIISVNCMGGEIYHLLGLRFESPTINCSFDRKNFIVFCQHLSDYMKVKPKIIGKDKEGSYIMSLKSDKLSEVQITFPHDNDPEVIISNWNKRKKRIDYNHIYIICDDRGLNEEDIRKIDNLDFFRKIVFTSKKIDVPSAFYVKKYKNKECVGKYNVKRFTGLYGFQSFFDYVYWLNIKR